MFFFVRPVTVRFSLYTQSSEIYVRFDRTLAILLILLNLLLFTSNRICDCLLVENHTVNRVPLFWCIVLYSIDNRTGAEGILVGSYCRDGTLHERLSGCCLET